MSESATDEIRAKIRYDRDSKRYHRFLVVDGQDDVTGSLYFSKRLKQLPRKVILEIESKEAS
jgi:hypothetical protein